MRGLDSTRIVEQGYDSLDGTYREWVRHTRGGYRSKFLALVLSRVPLGTDVLELGCGPGTDAEALPEGRWYTGVDLSGGQLEHAMRALPTGTFLHADLLKADFRPASFEAVVSVYAFNHLPREQLGPFFRRIHGWLRPGGWFCASFGTSDNPGTVERGWLGRTDMYFASFPPAQNDAELAEAGFRIDIAETVSEVEQGEGLATFHWVIARKLVQGGPDP